MSGAGDDSAHDHLQQQVIIGGLNIDNFDSDTYKCPANVFTLKLSQNIKLKSFVIRDIATYGCKTLCKLSVSELL